MFGEGISETLLFEVNKMNQITIQENNTRDVPEQPMVKYQLMPWEVYGENSEQSGTHFIVVIKSNSDGQDRQDKLGFREAKQGICWAGTGYELLFHQEVEDRV